MKREEETSTIFHVESFIISGMDCDGCGSLINLAFENPSFPTELKFPEDTQLHLYSELVGPGLNRHFFYLESKNDGETTRLNEDQRKALSEFLKSVITKNNDHEEFKIEENYTEIDLEKIDNKNKINLIIGLMSLFVLGLIYLLCPPSLLIILCAISATSTLITGRKYLIDCFNKITQKKVPAVMSTSVSSGMLLSNGSMIYHTNNMASMSTVASPMITMDYITPVALLLVINSMSEVRRTIESKKAEFSVGNRKKILPEMAEHYQRLVEVEQGQETFEWVNKALICEKNIIIIEKGSAFPIDCELISEQARLDTSLLNGESNVTISKGNAITSGAINLGEAVRVNATNTYYNSAFNKIMLRAGRNITDEEKEKGKREVILAEEQAQYSRFLKLYILLFGLSALLALLIPFGLGILTFSLAIQNITGLLFSVCFCSIGMAFEMPREVLGWSQFQEGMLIRNESLNDNTDLDFKTIIFDKTGTLTSGECTVDYCGIQDQNLLKKIRYLEQKFGGDHPLAKAVINHIDNTNVKYTIEALENPPTEGRGISGIVDGEEILIGNEAFFDAENITINLSEEERGKLENGLTPIYIAQNNQFAGVFFVAHTLRPGVKKFLEECKNQNKQILMFTGDTKESAEAFNRSIGGYFEEENIYSGLSPKDKEAETKKLINNKTIESKTTCAVGDALNDANFFTFIRQKGGMTFSIDREKRVSFFADASLNGSLNYLKHYKTLVNYTKTIKKQNQFLLILSSFSMSALLISMSALSMAIPPLLPLLIMSLTTILILANCYRIRLKTELLLNDNPSAFWLQNFLSSKSAYSMLTSGLMSILAGTLIKAILMGSFSAPTIAFAGAGLAASISSACLLTGGIFLGIIALAIIGFAACKIYNRKTSYSENPNTLLSKQQKPIIDSNLALKTNNL